MRGKARRIIEHSNILNMTTDVSPADTVSGYLDFIATTAWNKQETKQSIDTASVWVWLLSTCLFLTAIAAFLGNVLVIVTFFIDKRLLKSNFNVFLFNLTLTDVAVSVTAIPLYAVDYMYGFWPFDDHLCHFWIFCDWGMTFASVYTLLAISVDRYWGVCWSHHYRAHNTRRTTFFVITAIWCLVLIVWLPPYINDRITAVSVTTSGCLWSANNANNISFAIFMAVAGYHVPSFVIVYCYIRVFFTMKKSHHSIDKQDKSRALETGKQAVMLSTLTVSSFRSTDSDTGSNAQDELTKLRTSHKSQDRELKELEFRECDVKIIITGTDSIKREAGEIKKNITHPAGVKHRWGSTRNHEEADRTDPATFRGNQHLLRAPLRSEREEMMQSNMSLDLPNPAKIVKTREFRRPCSFTEGTIPTHLKHSRNGARSRWRNLSGSVRGSQSKHLSALRRITRASQHTAKSSRKRREYKLFVRVTYIVVAYVLCWTPFHIVFDCQLAGIHIDTNLYTFAVLMCYLNSTLNPMLYALGNPKLKAAFKNTLTCVSCKKRNAGLSKQQQ